MTDEKKKKSYLSDPKYLFTLLTALVKKQGGRIEITEEDMVKVTTEDMVTLSYDRENRKVILLSLRDTTWKSDDDPEEYDN
tara:strand:- start:4789 stop:5031 length:243 start_codon:yes stop_codon:yes gene_type:complete